jgi:hypothetical protein
MISGPGGTERAKALEIPTERNSPAVVQPAATTVATNIIRASVWDQWRAVAAGTVSRAITRITPTTRISVTTANAITASSKSSRRSIGTPATSANSSSKETAWSSL